MSEFLLAKKRLLYCLGVRDFSKKELRKKLLKSYAPETVELALTWAEENKWLPKEDVIAERVSNYLHQRKKGILAINKTLNQKGLPTVSSDEDLEAGKARALVQRKITSLLPRMQESQEMYKKQKDKCSRFLLSRGFSPAIVRKVVYEQFPKFSKFESDDSNNDDNSSEDLEC